MAEQLSGKGRLHTDVLIPTCNRPTALAATLATLIGQTCREFDLIVADQSDGEPAFHTGETRAIARLLRARGHAVSLLRNLPKRGMAQQRQFLLDQSRAPLVLFLDDDDAPRVLLREEEVDGHVA